MDKFTLFELHVHDGMEFSATNTAPAIGGAAEEAEELAEYIDASDADEGETGDDDAVESSRSRLPLVVGVVVVVLLAVAVRKFLGSGTELEVADLDDLVDEAEAYESTDAEH